MELKQSEVIALQKMHKFESSMSEEAKAVGWDWREVRTYPAIINKLMIAGLVNCTYSSNRSTCYMLTKEGVEIAKSGQIPAATVESKEITQLDTSLLFTEIVGYDDLKKLVRQAMLIEDPIHVLMHGPPSIAKSMFLIDIERAAGSSALPLLGSATSHAGMWDMMAEKRPRYLLIDEIEKMNLQDMAGLLSLMEHKRIIRAKVGRMLEIDLDCRVFAAANQIRRLPPELLSRFWKYPLTEYGAREFVQVVESVLVNREQADEDKAHQIAMGLVGKTHDVRDAIRVARLAKNIGVEESLSLWLR